MNAVLQGSLLDLCEAAGPGPLGSSVRRTALARGAWVDLRPGWIAGADALFERLAAGGPWRGGGGGKCRPGGGGAPRAPPLRERARRRLDEHCGRERGEPFRTAGLCLYRDGRDSVAWHGDTTGRGSSEDTMVAILSLGAARALALRPRGGGGPSRRYEIGH